MSTDSQVETGGGVIKTIPRAKQPKPSTVNDEAEKIFPQKGPTIVLDIDSGRRCYSRCHLDLAEQDLPRVSGTQAQSH